MRPFVAAWKERGVRRAADLAAELVAAHVERPPADVIAYIPPDPDRQLRRAVHPAEALAAELAARWELARGSVLVRTRRSARQTGRTLAERRANVRGLFAARRVDPGSVVALVDDVYTTGATASAAAHALRAAGASEVHVVTFARTPR